MYGFAKEPKWVLSHLAVLVLVLAMIGAGLWQLDRLQQRKDENELIRARQAEPVGPVDEVVDPADPTDVGDEVRLRRATAEGSYDVEAQVLVRNRSFDGAPGSWVLTPLVLDDGTVLVVNRGWVPVTGDQELPAAAAPPSGRVAVEGILESSQARGASGPVTPLARCSTRCRGSTSTATRSRSMRTSTRCGCSSRSRTRPWGSGRHPCPPPSWTRAPTSPTPSSGSPSRPSPWWATA